MRTLLSAALHAAIVTVTALAALRSHDAVLAVAAVAATVALLTWYAALSGEDGSTGLDVTGTLPGVALGIVGRAPWGNLLPILAVQAVVAVVLGAVAAALDGQLGPTLVIGTPALVIVGLTATLAGVAIAWVSLAIDGGAPTALSTAPVVVAGGTGPLVLVAAFHPAATLGLATAGLLEWDAAAVVVTAATLGTVVGTYLVSSLLPPQE